MRSLRRIALLFLMVIISSTSIVSAHDAADPDTIISVRQVRSEEKKAFIRITHLSGDKPAVLRIRDKQGYVLHREVIKQREAYVRKCDFSQLPSGE